MDFFSAQDHARASTARLVMLFLLAVITLIILTNILVIWVIAWTNSDANTPLLFQLDWQQFGLIAAGVSAVILIGSVYKIFVLSSGGAMVAESMNGRLISQNSSDPMHRKILNVVEEMAIASGMPVPPVYMLEEEHGINAFAAGLSPADAVIGVTLGCIEQLSREQLQGVIGHEFSHIINGDMRLNMRLIGILHGIMLIGMIGYIMLRSSFGGRRISKGSAAISVLGLGLMVVGYGGTFFGNLIKASVSRQREFLADASAVQFTRNPAGIAGALARIGGASGGSQLDAPDASELSHTFFSEGVSTFFNTFFATHPPLKERIYRIDPSWNGKYTSYKKKKTAPKTKKTHQDGMGAIGMAASAAMAMDKIGQANTAHLQQAKSMIAEIPPIISESLRETYGARAAMYAMLLDKNPSIQEKQLAMVKKRADAGVYPLLKKLMPEIKIIPREHILMMVDMAIPALRQLSNNQYGVFRDMIVDLIKADQKVSLFEWAMQKILLRSLDREFFRHSPIRTSQSLKKLQTPCALICSILSYAGNQQKGSVHLAFKAARQTLKMGDLALIPRKEITLSGMDKAMNQLAKLKPQDKRMFLNACVAAILSDQQVSPTELEMLRAFSSMLDCPMPIVLS